MPMPLSGLAQTLSNSVASVQQQIVDTQDQLASGVKTLNPGQAGVVTRLSAQATGYDQTLTNIGSAQSVISVAQASLTSIAQILTQMQALANQASSASLQSTDRDSLQATFSNLASQVTTLGTSASVNSNNLLSGTTGISVTTGISGSNSAQTTINGIDIPSLSTTVNNLSVNSSFTVSSATAANVKNQDTITVTGGSLAANATITIGGLTFTAGGVAVTASNVLQAYANFISGASITSSYGTFSGNTLATMQSLYSAASSTSTTLVLTSSQPGTQTATTASQSGSGITGLTATATQAGMTNQTQTITLASSNLPAAQSISIGGIQYTAGSSSVTPAHVIADFIAYINGGTPGSYGTFTGANTTMHSNWTASGTSTLILTANNSGAVTAAAVSDPGTINAAAAVASLTTQLQTVSTGQATLSAAATGLTAQASANTALKTGLTNTVNSIQNIDATAMQAKLQQLNNQQSIDYYLVSQMNTEAAAILSIFR
ncbi:hypothetical protein G6646_04195 [Polynucleobacter paneuropaeus]|nr:hypothetical protein [Polynucleobacter paneuropaeus]